MLLRLCPALLLSVSFTGLLAAEVRGEARDLSSDAWPQFRRDARRSGDNAGATLRLPLRRTTAVRFPAPVYSSPAVADGKVFVQDALGTVACIDPARNRALWTASVGGVNNTSSPAVADGKVFVGSTAGALFVLDAGTGAVLKRVPADGGVIAAPALANGAVYFSTFAGRLVKIDYAGTVAWSFDGGRTSTTEFAVFDRDVLFFAGTTNTLLYRLRDEGDKVQVVSKTPSPSNCCPVGGPAFVTKDSFAFQSFDSESGRFYLMKDGARTAVSTDVSDSRVTPAVRGDLVFRGDKCLSAATWKPVWRADPTVLYDGGFHSSPALAQDVLVVGCEEGRVHFVPLEGEAKGRRPVWQFKTERAGQPNSAVSSSPAVVAGRVFFGGEDGILYGLGQGDEVAVTELPTHAKGRPARRALAGSEWPTPGGDMGFSFVSADRDVRPPFDVAWRTRIWSVFKAPMVVADSKVFCAGRLGNFTALDAASGEIRWKTHHPGVESRPAPTYAAGKLLLMRVRNGQGDSPYVSGASGGPPGEGVWCHDPNTGAVVWHKPMPLKYHFNHDGLAAHDRRVFVTEMDRDRNIQAVAYAIDTGKEVWRRTFKDLPPARAVKETANVKASSKLPPRFSGVVAAGVWCVSISDRGTRALDPATGETVWANDELCITKRTRLAARDGTLVIFAADGDHALDARTGKPLWKGAATASNYTQALTDRYLKSEGREGVYPPAVCAWPVFANGHWYSHYSFTAAHGANKMACMKEPESAAVGLLGPDLVVWSYEFLCNACPSPSPAYGRLYYSPSAEGVVYCFAPAGKK